MIKDVTMAYVFIFLFIFQDIFWSSMASAEEPLKIRAGHSYYSDEIRKQGVVSNIKNEKNYEEVYQLYEYYEVVYDKEGRVTVFKAYQKGQLILTERYSFDLKGKLIKRVVLKPGHPDETTEF